MSSNTPGSTTSFSGPSSPAHGGSTSKQADQLGRSQQSSRLHDGKLSENGSPRSAKRHGGFLLGSLSKRGNVPAALRRRTPSKGKEKEYHYVDEDRPETPPRRSLHEYSPSIGSSPLASTITSVDGEEGRERQDSGSGHAPQRPLSHSQYFSTSHARQTDPNHLVNLALQLSQSRARAASARYNPHLIGAGASGRVVSLGSQVLPGNGSPRPDAKSGQHSSNTSSAPLVSAAPEDVEAAPGTLITNGLGTQHVESSGPGLASSVDAPGAVQFLPSPQTRIRAERARIALELRYHHRRLLRHLPRLPVASNNRSKNTVRDRADSEKDSGSLRSFGGLGRAYNPLQYARNRRTRYRERCSLRADVQGWKNLDHVRAWVDEVVESSDANVARDADHFSLPNFDVPGEDQTMEGADTSSYDDGDLVQANPRAHLPPNDWIFDPWDLLADAYWLQQPGNASLIEDANGDRILPFSAVPKRFTKDPLTKRHSQVSGIGALLNRDTRTSVEHGDPSSFSEPAPDHIGKIDRQSPNRKQSKVKQISKRFSRARSYSSSSESSAGPATKKGRPWSATFGKKWHGENMPDEGTNHQTHTQVDDLNGVGSSSEALTSQRVSKEIKRPLPLETASPYGPNNHSGSLKHRRNASALSDLDTTAPSSPATSGFMVNSSPKRRSVVTGSGGDEIERTDFADDPFQERALHKPQRGFWRTRAAHLSSPSEASFSAGSEERVATPSHDPDHHDPAFTPDRELGFLPMKSWKGAALVGRARGLLRRKDTGYDTSDTEDEAQRKPVRSPLFRAATSSTMKSALSHHEASEHGGESAQYQGLELPTFRSTRQNEQPSKDSNLSSTSLRNRGSGDRTRPDSDVLPSKRDSLNPAITISSAPSQADSEEKLKEGSDPHSRAPSRRRGTNERRGATVTDHTGNQWPLKQRTDAPPWPGQDLNGEAPRITWTGPELRPIDPKHIRGKEVARAKAILLSASLKSTKMVEYYQTTPQRSTGLLQQIHDFDPAQKPVSRQEEFEILMTLMAKQIDARSSQLDTILQDFTKETKTSLDSSYKEVKDRVQDELMEKALLAGDEADSLGAQLAGQCTMDVKALNDRIDLIWRRRRRRSRWLRRIAFTLLEWTVLTFMWAVWFMVICFKFCRGTLRFALGTVKWLFWL